MYCCFGCMKLQPCGIAGDPSGSASYFHVPIVYLNSAPRLSLCGEVRGGKVESSLLWAVLPPAGHQGGRLSSLWGPIASISLSPPILDLGPCFGASWSTSFFMSHLLSLLGFLESPTGILLARKAAFPCQRIPAMPFAARHPGPGPSICLIPTWQALGSAMG